jgi:uncharacterized membrane protein
LLLTLAALTACSGDVDTAADPVINDVWHAAKSRGITFRAIGQEPGWLLEITYGDKIVLVTDYGSTTTTMPYVDPVVHEEDRLSQYVLDSHQATIEIRGEHCADIMSGEEFEAAVTVVLDDRELRGCGRAL